MEDVEGLIIPNATDKTTNNSLKYMDILRIAAVFLVMYTHTYGRGVYRITDDLVAMWMGIILDCTRTCNNYIFLMVSGALLIGKNESIRRLMIHRVLRMVLSLLFFSLLYLAYYGKYSGFASSFIEIWKTNVISPFWFMYDYIGYLLCLPFLRLVGQNATENHTRWLLLLTILFGTVLPTISAISGLPSPRVSFLFGSFLTFPLLGYYFSRKDCSSKHVFIWGVLSISLTIISSILTYTSYKQAGEWSEKYIGLGGGITAVFIFLLFKYLFRSERRSQFYRIVGTCAFGVYWLAPIILEKMAFIYNYSVANGIPFIISNILYVAGALLFGIGVSYLLKKIPIVKRLI